MIDLTRLRREPDIVKAALARRGVSPEVMDAIILMDVEHRELLQEAERLRAEVKFLSRLVGEARRDKDAETAEKLTEKSRRLGDEERVATEAMERVGALLHDELLMIPNLPAPAAPAGSEPNSSRTRPTDLRLQVFHAAPSGQGAINVVRNKEELPWHLLLLPVNWTA